MAAGGADQPVLFCDNVGADIVAGHVAGGLEHVEDRVDSEGQGDNRRDLILAETCVFQNHEEEKHAPAGNSAGTDRGEDHRDEKNQQLFCRKRYAEQI